MNKLLPIFFLLSLTLNSFGQTEIKIRFQPEKLHTNIKLLIPNNDGGYFYEKYHYFKYRYWLIWPDTLTQESDSIYRGKITISINDFISKNPCDSIINHIRNSELRWRSFLMLEDTARLYIGRNNREFKNKNIENQPTDYDEYNLCHADYKVLNMKWIDNQSNFMNSIKSEKLARYDWMVKKDSLSNDFIYDFITNFDNCEIDFIALTTLIPKNTDGFVTVCNNLNADQFNSFIGELSDIPELTNTELAKSNLKESEVKSKRKKRIIRKLKNKKT